MILDNLGSMKVSLHYFKTSDAHHWWEEIGWLFVVLENVMAHVQYTKYVLHPFLNTCAIPFYTCAMAFLDYK
jgi:hypothetical protein